MSNDFNNKALRMMLRNNAPRRPGQMPTAQDAAEYSGTPQAAQEAGRILVAIPQEWKDVLNACEGREVIIAGGALRDLHNGRTVKDVDILIRPEKNGRPSEKMIRGIFAACGLKLQRQFLYENYGDVFSDLKANGNAVSVITQSTQTSYNFIFIGKDKSPLDAMREFDIGLCRIAYDGEKIIAMPEYFSDRLTKSLTVLKYNAGTPEHLERLCEKYRGWGVVNKFRPSSSSADRPQPAAKPTGG